MKRILFFVHFNKCGGVSRYVPWLLENVRLVYKRIVFISNSPLSAQCRSELAPLCDALFERENKGFDFSAWKDGMLKEGWDELSLYDSVTLMNDSCFGPLFDLEPVYRQMQHGRSISGG
jgi:rhamnosyltransferase